MSTINPAALDGTPYRLPPEPSRWRALTLAVVMHAGLLFFLWAGVSWQSTPPVAVEAEVWDMKVQSAAPPPEPTPEPKVAPEPPPPTPKPVERPPEVEPTPKPPDIALEQARLRAKELKELKERKAQEAAEKKLADAKAKKLEEEEKKKQELADKKKKDEADKKAKAAAAAVEKLRKQIREADMKSIAGAIGTSGTAARSTAPRIDSGYTASITAKVKSNTTFLGSTDVPGNPRAVFKVDQLPTGEIISARKIKSSGVASFDDAVEKGIIKSSPLPKKKDGTVERTLEIGFSMKDLD